MSTSTTQDHAFGHHIWELIRAEWLRSRTLSSIAANVPFDHDTWSTWPEIGIVDAGPILRADEVRGHCSVSGNKIYLRLPVALNDVGCSVADLGPYVVAVVVHELEHAQQCKVAIAGLDAAGDIRQPSTSSVLAAELQRAVTWLDDYYDTEVEKGAHARMMAVEMVERYGHPRRALDNLPQVWVGPTWRLISSRIYSSVPTDPDHAAHNTGRVAAFAQDLLNSIQGELEAMEIGA